MKTARARCELRRYETYEGTLQDDYKREVLHWFVIHLTIAYFYGTCSSSGIPYGSTLNGRLRSRPHLWGTGNLRSRFSSGIFQPICLENSFPILNTKKVLEVRFLKHFCFTQDELTSTWPEEVHLAWIPETAFATSRSWLSGNWNW